ncbi:MAG: PEP-CTERM sorting domain-containing protein [Luteolibacter sp.]
MKTKTILLVSSLVASGLSQGAISFTGTAVTGLGALTVPAGTLLLLVADTSGTAPGDGFLNGATLAGDLVKANDPQLLVANSSTTVGGTFGGDLILAKLGVTTAGAINGGFTFDNAVASQNRNFAILYFPSLTTSSASIPDGTAYGIVKGSDWVLTTDNTGQSTAFSTTDSTTSYFRVTVASGVATNDSFTTSSSPSFTIGTVPEPSAVLLGAIGALGLLRRRRI